MRNEPAEREEEPYERLRQHVETIDDELTRVEQLAKECENPALERNAVHLRGVVQTLEMNLPPRVERGED